VAQSPPPPPHPSAPHHSSPQLLPTQDVSATFFRADARHAGRAGKEGLRRLRLGTLNIRRDFFQKVEEISAFLTRNKIDVICLQETDMIDH
jgi:hypothetical protein